MNRNRVYLEHILDNIDHVARLTSMGAHSFVDEPDTQAAVYYYLHTLAESTDRLPDELKEMQPQIPWSQIRAFRNILVHDYLGVDANLVWQVIQRSLPDLRAAVKTILAVVIAEEESDEPEI